MRKFIYIIFAAALFATSCDSEQHIVENDDYIFPIHYGYMQFSTDVSTRTKLATDMRGKSFGIIGFEYSKTSSWSAAKSTTAPSIFYDQRINCNATNGVCTYDSNNPSATTGDNPKKWGDYRYAFFAYHPFGGAGITLSDKNKTNTPTLTYTYGWLGQSGNISVYDSASPIFDLMTAEAVDVDSQTGRVSLDFKHRLFAIEVLANNYNENEYEYEIDSNGAYILDDNGNKVFKLDANGNKIIKVSARKEISNLTLTLEGLQNTSMTIPLSMKDGEDEPKPIAGSVGTRTFKISDETVVVPAFNEVTEDGRGEGVATSISQWGSTNGGYLMLIPQDGSEKFKGTLNWTELKYAEGEEVSNEFTSTIDLVAGKLYQVYINFVGNGITIALIEAGKWDVHNVTHTFE